MFIECISGDLQMKNNIFIDVKKERSKRIFRFGYIGLFVMLLNAVLNFHRGLFISAILVSILALTIGFILIIIHFGIIRGIVTSIVITTNTFLVLISFAEGLQTGGYLYILSVLFALPFIIGTFKIRFGEIIFLCGITVICFCFCVIYGSKVNPWQSITVDLYNDMFKFNAVCVSLVCGIFAYMGIYFEAKYKSDLLTAETTALIHEQKIKKQNQHLQDIAYTNAHIVRAPLANILALTELIDIKNKTPFENEEIIELLKISAQQLDDNIQQIISKATDKTIQK